MVKNQRILVIDDNRAIHEDFRKIFYTDVTSESIDATEAALFEEVQASPTPPCFGLDSAYQGQEGLERVQQSLAEGRPYAMAFVDVRMPPGWDGIETVAHLWKIYPDLQVVICTAYSDYCWDEMNRRLGKTDRLVILKKPFDNIEVLQLAGALTEKWRLHQQARSHVRDLEVIIERRTEQLRKNEEYFRLITENAADVISIIDRAGHYLYKSPAFERILSLTPDAALNPSIAAHIHAEDRPAVLESLRVIAATGQAQVVEYRLGGKLGVRRTFELHGAPCRNAAGEIDSLLLVTRDISERKEAEPERQMLEVQLRQAQRLESIGQLATGIAHEINTPTQYIGDNLRFVRDSFTELLPALVAAKDVMTAAHDGKLNPELIQNAAAAFKTADTDYLIEEIPKAIEQTLQGIDRVATIVRAMKEFSHPGTPEKIPIDLNRAINSTLTIASNEWKYVADLETNFAPDLPLVRCLPGEMNQVVLNLVVNAAHAISDVTAAGSKGKGTLRLTTRQEGGWAEIRIQDTGPGIPERVRERIFDPFFTTKPVGKGTGQGLAIARSLVVDKHGGTIHFETEMGKGTTFIVRLPINGSRYAKGSEA